MKWLITGGCGFIGCNLARLLLQAANGRHQIRIIDNFSVGSPEDLAGITGNSNIECRQDGAWPAIGCIQIIQGDILDSSMAVMAAAGTDTIVHLAANTGVFPSIENPELDCRTNVLGTLNYLQAARHHSVSRFVFASSGAPIGECEPPIHENKVPHPVSPYGASKLAGEGYCSAYHGSFGIDTVILRFSNVYGPGSDHKESFVAKCIKKFLKGESVEIYGDGLQTRDFIFIDDLVNALILAATVEGIGGETFQIATGKETTVSTIVDLLNNIFFRRDLALVQVQNTGPRKGDVRRNYSDISKAGKVLGWKTEVALETGLDQTVDYFLTKVN